MSSRHLQDVFNVTIFRLPRRLEDVFKTYLQDVFKTYRRLGRQKNCYAEDVFKTCLEDTFKMSWRPTNVYWVKTDLMKLILFLLCFYKFIKNVSRITLSYFECYSFTQYLILKCNQMLEYKLIWFKGDWSSQILYAGTVLLHLHRHFKGYRTIV